MKTVKKAMKQKVLATLVLLLAFFAQQNTAYAQPPDCVSGTVAYTVFNDSISSAFSSTLDSLEIRPVNLLTGAVGALMGGRRYWVRKYDGAGSTSNNSNYIYGSSALAVDFVTSRFYVMTQMSGAMPKDVITINPVGGAMTTIATLPASMDDYHFVKMAAHTNGWIYAIGVRRDTTGIAANLINPVIRFQTCGVVPTAGCATGSYQLLGYLPSTGVMYKWLLFNGDISFDVGGNMFFATAALEQVGGNARYTDSRLFRINAADLPTSAGTGTIPMSFVADYNTLDSTVINGIGFNSSGTMFFTTRRYLGPQNTPLPPFRSELYRSSAAGTATLMPAFAPPTAGTSASDLATCYYPAAILAKNRLELTGQHIAGSSNLRWEVNANDDAAFYEVQRSSDGSNFETVAQVSVINQNLEEQKYQYTDNSNEISDKFYRVRMVLVNGVRYYSNIIKMSGSKIVLTGKVKPNPFVSSVELLVGLKTASEINIRVIDQTGRIFIQRKYSGKSGENKIVINEVAALKPGIYFIEATADNESVREKIIKQ